jgi:hypothetical protein
MDSESTRADVEAQLRDTAEAMSDRFDSLQEEMSTTGTSIQEWVARNPLKSAGGMLAAGLAVGALFGGGRSRGPERSELLDQYIQALRTEVDDAIAAGDTPGEALEKALQGRAPLVVYREGASTGEEASDESILGQSLGFATRLLAREVLKNVVLSLVEDTDIDDVLGDEIME